MGDRLVVEAQHLKDFSLCCTLIHSVYVYVHGAWNAVSASGHLPGIGEIIKSRLFSFVLYLVNVMEFLGFFRLSFCLKFNIHMYAF